MGQNCGFLGQGVSSGDGSLLYTDIAIDFTNDKCIMISRIVIWLLIFILVWLFIITLVAVCFHSRRTRHPTQVTSQSDERNNLQYV